MCLRAWELVLMVVVVELGALSELRVPVLGVPGLGDGVMRDVGLRGVFLADAVALAKSVVGVGGVVVYVGVGDAVVADVVVLAVAMNGGQAGFGVFGCDCRRSDGLDGGLDMIGMVDDCLRTIRSSRVAQGAVPSR